MNRRLSFFVCVSLLLPIGAFFAYATGGQEAAPAAGKTTAAVPTRFQEAPMLAAKVAKGELPSVDKRLPKEPSVRAPEDEVGQYGGQLKVFATGPDPWQDFGETPVRGTFVVKFAKDGTVVGDMAKSYQMAPDNKAYTLFMREGTKWSDGQPLTADDILFAYVDMKWSKEIKAQNGTPQVSRVIKVDDYTVRFEFDNPYPGMTTKLAAPAGGDWGMFFPKHYLSKWHLKYNPDAEKVAKDEGFNTWYEAFRVHYFWNPPKDVNRPVMQPWVLKQVTTTYKLFERNPYYWKVDTAGNQLPYIDSVLSTIVDGETYNLKIISGESDFAVLHTSFENYTLYKENEAKGNYRTTAVPGLNGAEIALAVNVNYWDPVLRPIYADVRFRQALSLAMNRKEINDVIYLGKATPRQATVLPSVSYYKKEWGDSYINYDPAAANKLLDEVGLNKRDRDGFRIGPDGKTFLVTIEYASGESGGGGEKMLELVAEYWQAVGLRTNLKSEEQALKDERAATNNHEIMTGVLDACEELRNYESGAEYWAGGGSDFSWARLWGLWFDADADIKAGKAKLSDFAGGKMPGEEPPADQKQYQQWVIDRASVPIGSKEYRDLSQKIYDFNMQKMYMIGTVGLSPLPLIAKNYVRNAPKSYTFNQTWAGDMNYWCDQVYIKK